MVNVGYFKRVYWRFTNIITRLALFVLLWATCGAMFLAIFLAFSLLLFYIIFFKFYYNPTILYIDTHLQQ